MTFTIGDIYVSRQGWSDASYTDYPYAEASVIHLDADGTLIETLDLPSGYDESHAWGVVRGDDGKLYVSYHGYIFASSLQSIHNAIGVFDTDGSWLGDIYTWAAGGRHRPGGLSLAPNGDLLVHLRSSLDSDNITRLTTAGVCVLVEEIALVLNIPRIPSTTDQVYIYRFESGVSDYRARTFDFVTGTEGSTVPFDLTMDEGFLSFDAGNGYRVAQVNLFGVSDETERVVLHDASLTRLSYWDWLVLPYSGSEESVDAIALAPDRPKVWTITQTFGATPPDDSIGLYWLDLTDGSTGSGDVLNGDVDQVFAPQPNNALAVYPDALAFTLTFPDPDLHIAFASARRGGYVQILGIGL